MKLKQIGLLGIPFLLVFILSTGSVVLSCVSTSGTEKTAEQGGGRDASINTGPMEDGRIYTQWVFDEIYSVMLISMENKSRKIELKGEDWHYDRESTLLNIGPVENHRTGREGGGIVYPVYSRRAGGLSLGINLFPDKKYCSFDCPYCEVFPFETDVEFSPDRMEEDLIAAVREAELKRIPVRDISFSGNGEPNLSPFLEEALGRVSLIRDKFLPGTELVLITNGTGLLDEKIFDLLRKAACGPMGLNIWLK
ncbi:hypothetical protein LJC14_05685, partial [Treponema sp. OttesenSCG-928-L16]|nr:hypothetical protein [Treponema sp. OttesenSCG-928-L16]